MESHTFHFDDEMPSASPLPLNTGFHLRSHDSTETEQTHCAGNCLIDYATFISALENSALEGLQTKESRSWGGGKLPSNHQTPSKLS